MKYAPKKEDMIGIRYIHCTRCDNGYFGGPAFAAQKFDGTFLLWGDPKSGGTAGEKERDLVSVVQLANTQYAFAARKMDGSVITWGHPEFGGDPGKKQDILVNVTNIVSSALAFVALKADGTVVAWGAPDYGGGNAHKQHELMGVLQVVATKSAFAARKTDGTVVAWGDWIEGGDPSRQLCGHSKTSPRDKQTLLVNVKKLTSNDCAFAALKADGTVITWGCSASGGDSESVKRDLVGVLEIVATKDSFAARRQDGIVVCWGARREFDKAKMKFSHMLSAEDLDEKGVELSASLVVQISLEDFY